VELVTESISTFADCDPNPLPGGVPTFADL
jgi:hypothetical protein